MKKLLLIPFLFLLGCPKEKETYEACRQACYPAHVVYFEAYNHCACGEVVGNQVNQEHKDDED